MVTTSTTWVCPHLAPEEWALIKKALAYAAKYTKTDVQTRAELEWLHDRVTAIQDRNLRRRVAMREGARRYRARQRALAEAVAS